MTKHSLTPALERPLTTDMFLFNILDYMSKGRYFSPLLVSESEQDNLPLTASMPHAAFSRYACPLAASYDTTHDIVHIMSRSELCRVIHERAVDLLGDRARRPIGMLGLLRRPHVVKQKMKLMEVLDLMTNQKVTGVAVVKEAPEGAMAGHVSFSCVVRLIYEVAQKRKKRASQDAKLTIDIDSAAAEEAAAMVAATVASNRRASRAIPSMDSSVEADLEEQRQNIEQQLAASFIALMRPVGEYVKQQQQDPSAPPPPTISISEPLADAVRTLYQIKSDRLYVVDAQQTLLGVLLAVDVFRLVLDVQCATEDGNTDRDDDVE